MISQLITALRNLHLEPTDEDIADILWLALHIGPTPDVSNTPDQPPPPDGSNEPGVKVGGSTSPPTPEPVTSGKKGKLYLGSRARADEGEIAGMLPIRAPAASALPGTLALGRALRPLMRKVASHTKFVIDEAQTAQRIAEEGLWLPVMNPAQERWLEVALVVDESRSMAIWWHTIAELQLLLERHGAFHDVRLWGLITDEDGQNARLRMGIGRSALGQPIHTPSELLDPSGRRLILVISDCVKPAWYNGTIVKELTKWGKRNPVALMQVLPRALWTMSALGNADAARLRARVPGQANMQLAYYLVNDWMNREETSSWLRLPTVTLEPGPLAEWARALTSAEDAWARGYVLDTQAGGMDALENENEDAQEVPLSAEERLKRFLATASPTARKLAGLLAATPITLPIVRLIQQTMLPKSQLSHVAEVFLGGLLEQLPGQRAIDADEVQYDFIPGIRELLLDSQPTNESAQVLRNVSAFVEDRLGQFLDFRALLADPGAPSPIETITANNIRHIQPFAMVGAKVLRRLGGRYAQVAAQLEQKVEASLPVTPPPTTEGVQPADGQATPNTSSSPQQTSPPEGAEQPLYLPTEDYRIVWVFGAGSFFPGYSMAWQIVFNQYLNLPNSDYIEVLWSTIFSEMVKTRESRASRTEQAKQDQIPRDEQIAEDQIRRTLTSNLQSRVSAEVFPEDTPLEEWSSTHGSGQTDQTLFPAWVLNPDAYIGEFVKYLVSRDIRNAVKEKVKEQLRPLASSGYEISIIAHSWGTVVAYESLIDLEKELPSFQLANLFTLGSPLWLVQYLLDDPSGRKPRNVANWVNIHAQNDVTGAVLTPGFQVDADYAVASFGGGDPHGSYFVVGNVAVQRDIVTATILGRDPWETKRLIDLLVTRYMLEHLQNFDRPGAFFAENRGSFIQELRSLLLLEFIERLPDHGFRSLEAAFTQYGRVNVKDHFFITEKGRAYLRQLKQIGTKL